MKVASFAFPLLALASLGACAFESTAPPVSSATASRTAEPQPPNSLPDGSAVNAPLTPGAGNIATTRVGPSTTTPARRR